MDDKHFNFVTQLCEGSDLFSNLEKAGGTFSEKTAAKVVKQILHAIKHLHDLGICHRDLKLENIMVETKVIGADPMIKVIDFGLAKYFRTNQQGMMTSILGTPYQTYEQKVISGKYNQACDMWSIGVITYCLIAGYPPFTAEIEADLYRKIQTRDLSFFEEDWRNVSWQAKDFILKALELDIKDRMSPEQGLRDPWILIQAPDKIDEVDPTIFDQLRKCSGFSPLQRHILQVLVSLMNVAHIIHIRNAFSTFDTDHQGTISKSEFIGAFRSAGIVDITEIEASTLYSNIKEPFDSEISWSSFLFACMDSTLLNVHSLRDTFQFMDSSGQGQLSFDDLKKSLIRRGHIFYSNKKLPISLDEIIREAGIRGVMRNPGSTEQYLDFRVFCQLMGVKLDDSSSMTDATQATTSDDDTILPQVIRKPSFKQTPRSEHV